MCKGWVVRGHRRELEFLDVDQWGRKDNLTWGPVYVWWALYMQQID
jgi:hypothetical protein